MALIETLAAELRRTGGAGMAGQELALAPSAVGRSS